MPLHFFPQPKPSSKLQDRVSYKKLVEQDDRNFKRQVWNLDKGRCRKCGCACVKSLERSPKRGEIHHAYGRIGVLRHDVRGAILVCALCHELLTGKVAERWAIVGKGLKSDHFTIREKGTPRALLNLRGKIAFERVA